MDGIRVIWNWMLDISVFWNTCNINVFCQLVFLWPNYLQASLPPSCLCWTCAPSIDQVCRWPCAQLELSVSSSCSLGWPLVRPLLPPCRAPMLIRERRVGNVCLACTLFVPLDHWSDLPNSNKEFPPLVLISSVPACASSAFGPDDHSLDRQTTKSFSNSGDSRCIDLEKSFPAKGSLRVWLWMISSLAVIRPWLLPKQVLEQAGV